MIGRTFDPAGFADVSSRATARSPTRRCTSVDRRDIGCVQCMTGIRAQPDASFFGPGDVIPTATI